MSAWLWVISVRCPLVVCEQTIVTTAADAQGMEWSIVARVESLSLCDQLAACVHHTAYCPGCMTAVYQQPDPYVPEMALA